MDLLDFVMDMSGFLYLLFSSFCFQGKYKKSSASFLVHWMKKFEVFGLLDGGGEFFHPLSSGWRLSLSLHQFPEHFDDLFLGGFSGVAGIAGVGQSVFGQLVQVFFPDLFVLFRDPHIL